jgi:hypothetical protein
MSSHEYKFHIYVMKFQQLIYFVPHYVFNFIQLVTFTIHAINFIDVFI